ncbi:MAG: acetyltransferase, partial [Dermacoccus nishinomiyaensis]
MARRPHTPLTYRPALDGLRALAVLGVLVFHLWPNAARGGWLGVDLFFVLSGYLITTLLVREYVQRGGIDLRGFWLARARRLMPTLVVVLLAVLVMATFWTLPSRRPAVSLDVLSTLAYVANWHFISGDEAYFASNGTPSPLRHAWSLAIEEQYYLLFPLLLLALTRFLTRRRHLAFWLLALAAASALWMAHLYVPGVDPTRVYYGTDTRAFELLIGAAAGAWIGPSQWGHARPAPWLLWLERLAWPALFALVIAMLTFDESSSGLFRG